MVPRSFMGFDRVNVDLLSSKNIGSKAADWV